MNKNKCEKFGITDFVSDDAFLKHYLSPTDATTQFWAEWLAQNPHKQPEWNEARQLVEAVVLGLNDYARTYLSEESQNHLLERIQTTNALLKNETPIISLQHRWIAAAASVLLIAGLWYFNTVHTPPSVYQQQITALQHKAVEKRNNT